MLSSLGVEGYYSAYHRDFFILFLKLGPQSKGSNVIVIKSSMVTTVTHRRLEEQYSRETRPHWYWATHLLFYQFLPGFHSGPWHTNLGLAGEARKAFITRDLVPILCPRKFKDPRQQA